MSKRKKANKLSDGRYPWEPKPETLERRSNQASQAAKTRAKYLSETPNSYKVTDLCQELYRLSGRGMLLIEVGKQLSWLSLDMVVDRSHKIMISSYNPEKEICVCEVDSGILYGGWHSINDFPDSLVYSSEKSINDCAKQILKNNDNRMIEFVHETFKMRGL